LIAVPLGLYAGARSAAFSFGKVLVCGPKFRGAAQDATMSVEVSDYRVICAAPNGDPQRIMTFHQDALHQPGVTSSARGYQIRNWRG
jgi:hypothetical protein